MVCYLYNSGDIDGDGIDDPDCCERLDGYIQLQFFKTYREGFSILGEVHAGAIIKFLDTFPGMKDRSDCKTVQQWILLGDPSLKIGGYID